MLHRPSRTLTLVFATLVALAFLLKAPFIVRRTRLVPDAVAYLDVARNLSQGRGLTSTLKLYHFDNAPVAHSALRDSPPLYPLLAGLVLKCGGDVEALQLVNTLLTCIAAGMVLIITTRLFDRRAALLAAAAAALAPNLLHTGSMAISDALALVLGLGALISVLSEEVSCWRWFAAGALAGLATLARYPSAVVALTLTIAAFPTPNGRRNGFACCLGWLLVIAQVIPHLRSMQAVHYEVVSFRRAMWNLGSPIDPWYGVRHLGFVGLAIARHALFYATDLLIGPRGLFLLGLGLPAWLLRGKRAPLSKPQRLLLIAGALNFAVYACTWSIPPVKGSRFMLLTYCLLLPFCAKGIVLAWDRWGRRGRSLIVVVCATTAAVYLWGCATTLTYSSTEECIPLEKSTAARIASSLRPGTAIASNSPWAVSYSTNAPTVLLPRNLDGPRLQQFISRYNIDEIVLLGNPSSRTASTLRRSFSATKLRGGVQIVNRKS